MGMPVAELLKRISGRELQEWRAYEQLHGPVGVEARLDQAAALIAERVTNCLVEMQPRPSQDTFMPKYGRRRPADLTELDMADGGFDGGRPA